LSRNTAEGADRVTWPLSRIASAFMAVFVLAALSISFAISFAAFVYTGPLAVHLSKGIGLALLGSIAMPLIVAQTASYRGTICHAQDVPAILLAGAAATIAAATAVTAPESTFATVATMIGVSTLFTGAVFYAAGRFRLGALARFIPYSVIGGFLAATGFLLFMGSLSMVVKDNVTIWTVSRLFESGTPVLWLPWMGFSVAAVVAVRISRSSLMLPAILFLGVIGFYSVIWLAGLDLSDATDKGLLLGPFDVGDFLHGVSPGIPVQADWGLILEQTATIVAVAAVAVVGLLLNASALEVALGQEFDFEHDLKSVGIANLAAGSTGGFVGYHLLGETLLASRMGLAGPLAGMAVALASAFTLFFGASAIGAFPVGLAASVIAFLGIDLLYDWLWVQRRRLPASDMAIIGLILVTAAAVGFLEALVVGLLSAAIMFIVSYAGIDVVRLRSDGAVRRSSVERGRDDLSRLVRKGHETRIFELGGFLFFGTASRLLESLRIEFESENSPKYVIFDLSRVTGVDSSAAFAFFRMGDLCLRNGAEFALTGIPDKIGGLLETTGQPIAATIYRTLDDALLAIETRQLERTTSDGEVENVLDKLSADYPELDTSEFAERLIVKQGAALVTEGGKSTPIFQLLSGQLRAEISGGDGGNLVVARFVPGALVGEIAYYAGVPRTAAVLADTDSEVLKIDLDRIPKSLDGRAAAADLHRLAAGYLARRLMRMTELFRMLVD
jgi:sulfate permease, SulP family